MGILLYFKSRGFIGRIGTWAPLYLKGINFFLVQSAYSSTMDGLHGKYLQHSHRQENLCQRLKKNHQFWSTEPHSHVMTEDRGGTFSREAEVYITKTNLIQKKKYQSCRICYVGEKNHFLFRQLYCTKSLWGSQTRADRTFTTRTWYSYPDPVP